MPNRDVSGRRHAPNADADADADADQ